MRIAQTSRINRWVLGALVLAGLTACGTLEQEAAQVTRTTAPQAATLVPNQAATASAAPTASQSANQPQATGVSPTASDWPIYRSAKAGYSVAYPAGWIIHEQTDGAVTETTFMPSDGAAGITVGMQVADVESAEPLDLPSARRCRPVVIGVISGWRCLDVVRLQVPAPPGGQGKSYIIATTGPGIDQALYQRFLDSFAPTQ